MEVGVQLAILIVATFVTNASSTKRGFQQPCGAPLHARSRETIDARSCDYTKGLICVSGICECNNLSDSKEESPIWNRTHCVVKLNDTCRFVKNYGAGLAFLPNLTQMEEFPCGKGAVCTDERECECEEGLVPEHHRLNCVIHDGQPLLEMDGIIILLSQIVLVCISRFI